MTLTDSRKGFTLVELMAVIAMIAIIMAAVTTAVTSARERAAIQKATTEVKEISQAILAYENYDSGGYELPTLQDAEASQGTIGFLLGVGGTSKSGKIPVLLNGIVNGGKLRDPWGTPYRIKIQRTSVRPTLTVAKQQMMTGFYLPNFYRLTEKE